MKTLLIFMATVALALAADAPKPKTAEEKADQRFAAEQARRRFYQTRSQITELQAQATAQATEFNSRLAEIKASCDSGEVDDDSLACKPKPAPSVKK